MPSIILLLCTTDATSWMSKNSTSQLRHRNFSTSLPVAWLGPLQQGGRAAHGCGQRQQQRPLRHLLLPCWSFTDSGGRRSGPATAGLLACSSRALCCSSARPTHL